MKLSIGLFGFGKTGSVVANEIINDESCELKWVVRKSLINEGEYASHLLGHDHNEGMIHSYQNINQEFYKENNVDIIVDFSSSCAVEEYFYAAQHGSRIVSAISNYSDSDYEQLELLGEQTAVLYSPNITLGINILLKASKLIQKVAPNADIEIIEEHFRGKQETSGTAIKIAENLSLNIEQSIKSLRIGGTVGKHEVIFGFPNQTIRIIHESINREAFGQGALYAAKWIMSQTTGMYSMEQALSLIMSAD